VFKQIAED